MDRKLLYRGDQVFIPDNRRLRILPVLFLTAFLFLPCSAFADWSPLIDRLVADGFDESAVRALFSRPEVRFEPSAMITKLEELMKRADKKPAGLPSYNPKVVYKGYLKEKVITRARSYLRENTRPPRKHQQRILRAQGNRRVDPSGGNPAWGISGREMGFQFSGQHGSLHGPRNHPALSSQKAGQSQERRLCQNRLPAESRLGLCRASKP